MDQAGAGRYLGPVRLGWKFFGMELKRCREKAGLTQQELGERVFVSAGYIGQFEQAVRKPQLDLARRFDEVLGTEGTFERMWEELISQSPHAAYFADTADLEPLAESISDYHPQLVPGLLQTEAYAHAVFRAAQPLLEAEEVNALVAARLDRSKALFDPKREVRAVYWGILDEAAIRRPAGTDEEMAEQLEHIAELMRKGAILLQVMPFAAGTHPFASGAMRLMTFPDAPPVAYVEGPWAGQLLDDPPLIAKCRMSYDLARAAASSFEASLALIESAAEEYRHGR